MFATISRSGRILQSVYFAGGRSSYDWSYAWSRDLHRLEKIDDKIHHSKEIVRLVLAINDRSYDQSRPPTIDRTINRGILHEQPIGGATGRKVARPVARLIVRPLTIWNNRFKGLNMTIDLVATDLPLTITHDLCDQSYDLCGQSYTFFLRFAHDCNIFRSQVGRNLVVSLV